MVCLSNLMWLDGIISETCKTRNAGMLWPHTPVIERHWLHRSGLGKGTLFSHILEA
jgi:hypothetical protein